MVGSVVRHAENERLRTAYISMRAKFEKLIAVIEKHSKNEGYQGVELAAKSPVDFVLYFFDKIKVQAEFTGVIEDKKQQMLGQIVFFQNGNECRKYYFDEFDNIFDVHGHEINKGKLFDVRLTDHILTEVYHKLIEDGLAFETVKLWR